MGANAQTSVPAFTAGQVLTAAQVTQINTGIPVFASSTERDAAFGGSGEKTLAEGQMAYLEDTNETQYYDGSSWAAIAGGAMTLVATATPSAVSSASIDNCFTADYANYMILYQNTAASAANNNLKIRLRASSTDAITNYYYQKLGQFSSTVQGQLNDVGTDEFEFVRINTTYPLNTWGTITLFGPAVAAQTLYSAYGGDSTGAGSPTLVLQNYQIAGYQSDSTAFDGFTLLNSSGTFSGKVHVYGIADS